MNTLRKKSAVVTGGGTGIGLAIAQALAARGAQVVIAGRRETVLSQAARSWEGDPPLRHHPVDVRFRESVDELFGWVREHLRRVDILVNSAGMNIANRSMAEMRPDQWEQVLAINATGTYNCMHAVLPQMRKRGGGLIVNISSISGKRAAPLGGVAYNAWGAQLSEDQMGRVKVDLRQCAAR